MIKNIIKKLYKNVGPFLSVWIIAIYLWFLFQFNYAIKIPIIFSLVFFVPIIFYEFFSSSLFDHRKLKKRNVIWGKVLFWFLCYILILLTCRTSDKQVYVSFGFPLNYMIKCAYGVCLAEYYITIILFMLWLIMYYVFVVRKRVLRIFISFLLPLIIIYCLSQHFYYYGGLGESSQKKILNQPGVQIFYSKEDFPKNDYFHYLSWRKNVSNYPRSIYLDKQQNAIYAVYANTLGAEYRKKVPCLLRIDLETKETKYFLNYFTRDIYLHASTILIAPWFEKKIYEIDKENLSIKRTFDLKNNMYPWKVRNIACDVSGKEIYITNDLEAAIQKYNYKSGEHTGTLYPEILQDYKYTIELWLMQVSKKTGKIYLAPQACKDYDIIEIDSETLKILRTIDLKVIEPTALYVDDKRGHIYCQDGGTNRLYEIDLKNFKVKRLLKGEVEARKIMCDQKRNCLYLLSYFYGKIVVVDLDSGKRLWEINVGGKPYGMAMYKDILYVNSMVGIIKIDLIKVWKEYIKN